MNRVLISMFVGLALAPFFAANGARIVIDPESVVFWVTEARTVGSDSTEVTVRFFQGFFECTNYTLPVTTKVDSSTVTVDLGRPKAPTMCLTAFGPATGECTLRLSKGEHNLKLGSNQKFDSYTLTVRDSSVVLKKVVSSFSVPAKVDLPEWIQVSDSLWEWKRAK